MRDRLKARLPKASDEQIELIADILERYEIKPTVKNLDTQGFKFFDLKNRVVRALVGEWRGDYIHVPVTDADTVIISTGGIIAGWIETSKLENLEDRFLIDIKSLFPMPNEFSFDQQCAHLSVHGGIYEGEYWLCLGCSKHLVYNDR